MKNKYIQSTYYGDEAPRLKDFIRVMVVALALIGFSYLADHFKLFAGKPATPYDQQHVTASPPKSSVLEIYPFILKGFFVPIRTGFCPQTFVSICITAI